MSNARMHNDQEQRLRLLKAIDDACEKLEQAVNDVQDGKASVDVIQLRTNDVHVAVNQLAASYFKTWALSHTN